MSEDITDVVSQHAQCPSTDFFSYPCLEHSNRTHIRNMDGGDGTYVSL